MQIEFTTRGLLAHFFRQGRKIALVFLAVYCLGVAYVVVSKPMYETGGSLLVKFGNNTPERITHEEGGTTIVSQDDRRETMQSNIDILQSHDLILSVVNVFGPEAIYPGITEKVGTTDSPAEATVYRLLKKDLTIKSGQFSNVIEIKMQSHDPEIATKFVHKLMEMFIARQSEIFNKPQTDFLREQVKQAGAKLEESQKKLEDFKAKYGISLPDKEIETLLQEKSETATASLDNLDSARDKVAELQGEEAKLRLTYLPQSPEVQHVHQQVMVAQEQLRERQEELQSRTGGQSAKISKRISALEGRRKEYDDLVRQVEIDEKNYRNYQSSSEEARVSATLNQKNITSLSVVDEPTVPVKPAYPRKMLVLALAMLAGIVTSLGVALTFETFDQRFTEPTQLARVLGVPVMASFGHAAGKRRI